MIALHREHKEKDKKKWMAKKKKGAGMFASRRAHHGVSRAIADMRQIDEGEQEDSAVRRLRRRWKACESERG